MFDYPHTESYRGQDPRKFSWESWEASDPAGNLLVIETVTKILEIWSLSVMIIPFLNIFHIPEVW